MTAEQKQQAKAILGSAYRQMLKETSGRPCVSRRVRQILSEKLRKAYLIDARSAVCRFCALLAERMDVEERFDLTGDLEWLDAVQDLLNYGEPIGWKITRNGALQFS